MNFRNMLVLVSYLLIAPLSLASQNNSEFESLFESFKSAPDAYSAWALMQPQLANQEKRSLTDRALVFALWDQAFEDNKESLKSSAILSLAKLNTLILEDVLFVRAAAIKLGVGFSLSSLERSRLDDRQEWSEEALITLETLSEYFEGLDLFSNKMSRRERRRLEFLKESSRKDEWESWQIKDLLSFSPRWRRSMRSYQNGPKLYLFCRHNREFPCMMVMKNADGNWVRENGKIWSQQKLALSRKGIPSHKVNGHTPQGIYTIDSVMPSTNRKIVFGKFRRLIINFIEKDRNDKTMMSLMPESLESLGWWKAGAVARDVGRSLLRIHGTGTRNINSSSPWYPFYPTVGCVASKENTYNGVSYVDQRELLDTMMESMGLSPRYSNETKLKGLLYVVDINSEEAPVSLEEIEPLL